MANFMNKLLGQGKTPPAPAELNKAQVRQRMESLVATIGQRDAEQTEIAAALKRYREEIDRIASKGWEVTSKDGERAQEVWGQIYTLQSRQDALAGEIQSLNSQLNDWRSKYPTLYSKVVKG